MDKLRIGITGHRDLREEDIEALSSSLADAVNKLREANQDRQIQMLNALASGADRLAADYAIKSGMELVAVLPFSAEMYEEDFADGELTEFRKQLKSASDVIIPEHSVLGKMQNRDDGYRAAGRYIADNCDYLIAFWDGASGTDEGCGTGDIVKYFTDRHTEKLIHIKTIRRDKRPLTEIKKEADEHSLDNQ